MLVALTMRWGNTRLIRCDFRTQIRYQHGPKTVGNLILLILRPRSGSRWVTEKAPSRSLQYFLPIFGSREGPEKVPRCSRQHFSAGFPSSEQDPRVNHECPVLPAKNFHPDYRASRWYQEGSELQSTVALPDFPIPQTSQDATDKGHSRIAIRNP